MDDLLHRRCSAGRRAHPGSREGRRGGCRAATLYTGATPTGEHVLDVANPRHFVSSEKRLAHAQRVASRRQGPRQGVAPSKRWQRANARVRKVHANVAHSRGNLIHETTTMLAKRYDVVVVEDLNVAGMMKNRPLAKHISDAAWAEFVRQLEYKTTWYGSTLVKADRLNASSKTCSQCGTVKATLSLDERVFHMRGMWSCNRPRRERGYQPGPTRPGGDTLRHWTWRGGQTESAETCGGGTPRRSVNRHATRSRRVGDTSVQNSGGTYLPRATTNRVCRRGFPRQFHQIQHHRKHHTPQLLGATKPTGTDDDSVRTKGCYHRTDTSKQVAMFS